MNNHPFKVKNQNIKIDIDIAEYRVNIFFVRDVEEFRNGGFLKKYPDMRTYPGGPVTALHSYYYNRYPRESFVFYPTEVDLGTIIHELTHVVDKLMEYMQFEGTEFRAHCLEYLLNQLLKKVKQ